MRESSKAALGGIVAALGIVIMLATYLSPLLVYTVPPFTGIMLIIILEEIDLKWAFGTYAAIGLLSLFLIADKESAIYFVMFFGYYPILREYLRSKLKSRKLIFLIGLFIFNLSMGAAVLLCAYVFHIDYSELSNGGVWFLVLFAVLLNIVYAVFDFLVEKLHLIYRVKLKKRIKKLFK